MRGITGEGTQVILGVGGFMGANVDGVPETDLPVANLRRQRELVLECGNNLKALGLEQEIHDLAANAATGRAKDQMRRLRTALISPVVRASKRIMPDDPELRAVIKISRLTTYRATIVAANGLAERVGPHKAKFVDAGLSENFVEVLQSSAAELQQTLNERSDHVARRAHATAGIEAEYARGRDLVKILDAMLSSLWAKDPARLAQWKSVSRLPSPDKKGKSARPVTPTTPVVTTPETPAAGGNASPKTDVA
jgi:hypothetical protein